MHTFLHVGGGKRKLRIVGDEHTVSFKSSFDFPYTATEVRVGASLFEWTGLFSACRAFKEIARRFEKCTYFLSCQELDEKIDTIPVSVG